MYDNFKFLVYSKVERSEVQRYYSYLNLNSKRIIKFSGLVLAAWFVGKLWIGVDHYALKFRILYSNIILDKGFKHANEYTCIPSVLGCNI